jgi:hypothetical protein
MPAPGNPTHKPALRNGRHREWLSYLSLANVDGSASVTPASIAPALSLPPRHQQLNTGVPHQKKAYVDPYMTFLSLTMLVPASYPSYLSCPCMSIFFRSSLSLTMRQTDFFLLQEITSTLFVIALLSVACHLAHWGLQLALAPFVTLTSL